MTQASASARMRRAVATWISYSMKCSLYLSLFKTHCCARVRADEEPESEREREAIAVLEKLEVLDEVGSGMRIAVVTA